MDYWKSPDWSDFFRTILISGVRWFKEENPSQLMSSVGLSRANLLWSIPLMREPEEPGASQVHNLHSLLLQLAEEARVRAEVTVGVVEWAAWWGGPADWWSGNFPGVDALIHSWAGANEADSSHIVPSPTCQQSITRRRRRCCKWRHYSHRTSLWFTRQWELREHPARSSWTR